MEQKQRQPILLVHWKRQDYIELYVNLKSFCDSHSAFNYNEINISIKSDGAYDTPTILIERRGLVTKARELDLPKLLFRDFNSGPPDWMLDYRSVIHRVIDQGTPADYQSMINLYGQQKIVKSLKEDILYMTDSAVSKACQYFQLRPEELKSYTDQQSRMKRWI